MIRLDLLSDKDFHSLFFAGERGSTQVKLYIESNLHVPVKIISSIQSTTLCSKLISGIFNKFE